MGGIRYIIVGFPGWACRNKAAGLKGFEVLLGASRVSKILRDVEGRPSLPGSQSPQFPWRVSGLWVEGAPLKITPETLNPIYKG